MTATDELRAMLDERGVEWRKTPHYSSDSVDNETVFCGEGIEWLAHDHLNGKLGLKTLRYEITPAQVISATLGDNDATRARQLDAIDEILRTLNAEVTNDNIKYGLYSELYDMIGELANLIESCAESIEHNVDGSYECPKCGCVVDYDVRGDDERIITMDDYVIPLNFCPKCGARTEEDE